MNTVFIQVFSYAVSHKTGVGISSPNEDAVLSAKGIVSLQIYIANEKNTWIILK